MRYQITFTKEIVLNIEADNEGEALASALSNPILTLPMDWEISVPTPMIPAVEIEQEYNPLPPGMDEDIYEDEG